VPLIESIIAPYLISSAYILEVEAQPNRIEVWRP